MRGADRAEWDEFDRPAGGRSPEELKRIARYQRWVIVLILAQLALWAVWGALEVAGARRGSHEGVRMLLFTFTLAAGAFVFMLESTLNGVIAGFAGGLMSLVPGVGVLLQALVNRAATTELKKHGLEVGLFGANVADLAPRWSPYDIDEETGW